MIGLKLNMCTGQKREGKGQTRWHPRPLLVKSRLFLVSNYLWIPIEPILVQSSQVFSKQAQGDTIGFVRGLLQLSMESQWEDSYNSQWKVSERTPTTVNGKSVRGLLQLSMESQWEDSYNCQWKVSERTPRSYNSQWKVSERTLTTVNGKSVRGLLQLSMESQWKDS